MSGFTINLAAQIQAGAPGSAFVGPNTRLKGAPGFASTQVDALFFSNGAVGSWTAPNTRTRTLGTFMTSQTAQGLATIPGQPPIAVIPVAGDPRVRSV